MFWMWRKVSLVKDCLNNTRYNFRNNKQDSNRQCYACGETIHWIKDCRFLRDLQEMIKYQRQQGNFAPSSANNRRNQQGAFYAENGNDNSTDEAG